MKRSSILPVLLLILLKPISYAQVTDEKILMTVNGKIVEAGEFVRMYNKSLDPTDKTDINQYLNQFIDFKLKVADAIASGYDTTKAFRDELKGYRNQLAQNYLTDPEIKEKLLKKAYQRSLTEVNASHILVSCPPAASPEDTLKAYKKALDIRERIIKGEDFGVVARATSDDKSVLVNKGNLGYFTVFQMITPFEEAAYKLKPGSVSMPVRTSYGYHIIRVNDRRPSKGKVKVAHIMKAAPPGSDEEKVVKAETEINNIYERLQNGESFRKLALETSDHKESASNGGELNWFGAGEIISDFSEAAFALKDTGEYCKPVRSPYGFHIIKLLDRKAPGSFEDSRSYLESRLNQSDLNSASKKSFIEKLKKEYKYTLNSVNYNWFLRNTDTLIINGISKFNKEKLPSGDIYSFADQHLSTGAFADYLETRGNMVVTRNPKDYIDSSIESIAEDDILKYEDSILEKKYPDFKYLINEFHDGILLFDISSAKVWNKVQNDSTGLKDYYNIHRSDFMSGKSIEGTLYTLRNKEGEKQLKSAYKQYSRKADCDQKLKERFNSAGDTVLLITEGKWFERDDSDIDAISWTTGVHYFDMKGFPSVINIKKINPPEPLPMNRVMADMVSGYQEWLNNEWIRELKVKYEVNVDNIVFNDLKRNLGQ